MSNFKEVLEKVKHNEVVSALVIGIKKDFLEIELDNGLKGIIKRLDISKNKQDQKTEKFSVGDRVDAKVMLFNNVTGKLLLSIKDMEADEQVAHNYESSDSGATIGSIAGELLKALEEKNN